MKERCRNFVRFVINRNSLINSIQNTFSLDVFAEDEVHGDQLLLSISLDLNRRRFDDDRGVVR